MWGETRRVFELGVRAGDGLGAGGSAGALDRELCAKDLLDGRAAATAAGTGTARASNFGGGRCAVADHLADLAIGDAVALADDHGLRSSSALSGTNHRGCEIENQCRFQDNDIEVESINGFIFQILTISSANFLASCFASSVPDSHVVTASDIPAAEARCSSTQGPSGV